jgi:hypothetical protein
MSKYRSACERLLQLLKGFLSLWRKFKEAQLFAIFASFKKIRQRRYNLRITSDKPTVEVRETEKDLQLPIYFQRFSLVNRCHSALIYRNLGGSYNIL